MLKKLHHKVLGALFLLTLSCATYAQTTTSSLSGKITNAKGEELPGATVLVVHTPTGTNYGAAANAEGRYNLANLNPGGPYEITVTFVGFKIDKRQDVNLSLGQRLNLDFILQDETTQLTEVTVVGSLESTKTGTGTSVGKEQIQALPTLTRSFSDFTRLTPQSSNNSFAGTNFRYNNITLDGAINNDAIGFSPSLGGQGGTANQPGSSTRTNSFSLDAISQVQVQIAPYDVSLGNFTGGSVNAVSRSGTNDVSGSVYGFGRNSSITGKYKGDDKTNDGKINSSYYDYQTGFRLGLPIIKNKLFFFTNEEITHSEIPQFFPAGAPGYFMSQATADAINGKLNTISNDTLYKKSFAQFKPGSNFNAGTTGDYNIYSKSTKFFNRIDWNINAKHQLALRNNTVISEASNLERSSSEFQFGSYDFIQKNTNISTVAELKSRFSNKFSNNLILGYTTITDKREPVGTIFPQIQINSVGADPKSTGSGTVFIGTNREAAIFNMSQKTLEITDNFKIFLGNHSLTLGTHNELYNINYTFINSWNGRFEFSNVGNFLLDKPSRLRAIYNPTDNSRDFNLNNTPAKFNINLYSLYAQDEWAVNKKLTLTYGVRGDMTSVPTTPTTLRHSDASINSGTNFGTTYQYDNKVNQIDNKYFGKVYISPRVGFNYDVKGDQSIILRGGSGLFTGRIPFAWLGYTFINNGVSFSALDANGPKPKAADAPDPGNLTRVPLPTDPNQFKDYSSLVGAGGRVELNILDNNFSMPRMWRSNFAVDFKILNGYKITLEGIYTKTIKDVMIKQINLKDSVAYGSYDALKQQPLYLNAGTTGNRNSNSFSSVYLITNTNQGYRYQLTGRIEKSYPFGLSVMAAYTYGYSKDILNGIRNSPESGWQLNQNLNPNAPALTLSNFDIRNRIVSSVMYKKSWNEALTSYLSLIFTAESGSPFTWVNGSNTITGNGQQIDLAYVPTKQQLTDGTFKIVDLKDSKGVVLADAPSQIVALNTFIDSDKYLSSRRGQFTERNGGRTPWNTRLDFRFMQDFNFKVGSKKHTFQLTFDIINLTNMLNKDWGKVYFTPNTRNSSVNSGITIVSRPAPDANLIINPTYNFTKPSSTYSVDQFSSRWQGQLGLRYSF